MHFVKNATYLGGHKLAIRFDDGVTKIVDLAAHLDGEVFQPLRDPKVFASFRVDPDTETVCWDSGADFSPDWLYQIGVDATSALRMA